MNGSEKQKASQRRYYRRTRAAQLAKQKAYRDQKKQAGTIRLLALHKFLYGPAPAK